MKIISVNVGLPRKVEWKGKTVTTGIYKDPLPGSVNVRTLNIDGDGQADLSVHGGPSKAVGCVCQVVEKSFVIRHGDYAAGVARASSWYPTNARRVMAPERSNPKSSSKTAS